MEIMIHGRNINVEPKLQSYVERKVERLDRYMPGIIEVRIDLAREKAHKPEENCVAQMTVRNQRGTILRAEERTADLYASVDSVVDKMYRQIERYKGRRRKRGEQQELAGYETAIELDEGDIPNGQISRRKEIGLVPMYEEEAIEQLELLGHDFFVFINAESGNVNVLYRRRQGDFGILETFHRPNA